MTTKTCFDCKYFIEKDTWEKVDEGIYHKGTVSFCNKATVVFVGRNCMDFESSGNAISDQERVA